MTFDLNYADRVRKILLSADTQGITFAELNQRVRTPNHPTSDLRELLNAWQRRKWVDNFKQSSYGKKGARQKEIWRATQLLFEQWGTVNDAIVALVQAPGLPLGRSDTDQGVPEMRTSGPETTSPEPATEQ